MEVKPLNGAPGLFMGGKAVPALMGSLGNAAWVRLEEGALRLEAIGHKVTELFSQTKLPGSYVLSADLSMTKCSVDTSNACLAIYAQGRPGWTRYLLLLRKDVVGYRVILGRDGPGKTLEKFIDVPHEHTFGKPVHLKLVANNGTFTLFADGESLGTVTDPAPLPSGKLRVSVYAAAGTFDNLHVVTPEGEIVLTDDFEGSGSSENWRGGALSQAATFAEIGIHLYTAACGDLQTAWKGPGEYDWSEVDGHLERLSQFDPEGRLLARFYGHKTPAWWLGAHPNDRMTCIARGTGARTKAKTPSFSSEAWRRDVSDALRDFLRHLKESPNGHRIVGINICGGASAEWVYSWQTNFHDYSPVQLAGFRKRLREKYGTVEQLRGAWKDKDVSFETAAIPTAKRRAEGDFFEFFDPAQGRQVPDYMRYHSEAVTGALTHFARVIKKATGGEMFTTAFYGYHFPSYNHYHDMGHNDLASVLRCPHLDSLCCPHNYQNRQAGGLTHAIQPMGSIRLHGKLWFDEDDTRTHLSPPASSYGRTNDLWETVNVLKRNFTHALSESAGLWHMDWQRGWYADDGIMRTIAAHRRIAEFALTRDRRRNAEIALVISEKSLDYLRSSFGIVRTLFKSQYHDHMSRIGAPFDTILLSDLALASEYKLYIFLDAFYLTADDKRVIKEKVLCNGHTVLWLFGPGFVTETGLSSESTSRLTGMRIRAFNGGGRLRLTLCDLDHPVTRGITPSLQYQTLDETGPIFYVDDDGARVLGMTDVVPCTNSEGIFQSGLETKPGFAVKEMPGWRSIWCAVPNLPPPLLRNIAGVAGVHIYDDAGDFVCANQVMVAVHAHYAGKRTIRLPRPCTVTDAFDGALIAEDAKSFEVNLKRNETRIWWLGRGNAD